MDALSLADPAYRRELGDGLVARWSTAADAEPVVRLFNLVFRTHRDGPPDPSIAPWLQAMFAGRHPLIGPGDFAVVEAPERGEIVCATGLMAQTWDYAGLPLPVGRPEIVGTAPAFRRRGLVRTVFELIHARSAARGHLAQGIAGIAYFYRQFGYEYALDLHGDRVVPFAAIPALPAETAEPYRLRDVEAADLPAVVALYDRARAARTITARVDFPAWSFLPDGLPAAAGTAWRTQLLVDAAGRRAGLVLSWQRAWSRALCVIGLALEPGVALTAVMPSLLRALRDQAPRLLDPDEAAPVQSLRFVLGRAHPVYDVLGPAATPGEYPPYAWYIRVPDLPALMRHVAPVLERRLAASVAVGYSGQLRLEFYRGGLRLDFTDGRLTAAQDWQAEAGGDAAHAGFPPLVFLKLLFGHRSVDDLLWAFPDAYVNDEVRPLVEALFPSAPAWVPEVD